MSDDRVYFAIGDIHGEAKLLARLHGHVLKEADRLGGASTVVHLGDYVDRGPDSRDAIEQVMALASSPPAGVEVVSLLGNHERMMLDAIAIKSGQPAEQWLVNGGEATLKSYAAAHGWERSWRDMIDGKHIHWMRALPTILENRDRRLVFVHAGIAPEQFPDCDEAVRLWTRSPKFRNARDWPEHLRGLTVVHGHTPTQGDVPEIEGGRIGIDTGACYGGALTAAILAPGEPVRFFQVDKD